jgi:hypothetical protein
MTIRSDLKRAAEAVMGMNYPWEHTIRDGRLGKTSTEYARLAHPSNVLGLIAENERNACRLEVSEDTLTVIRGCLKTAETDLSLIKSDDLKYQALREQEREISQLKAENTQIKNQEIELKAECEGLRKVRVPAGLYRELVALRELRDQAKAYVDGYLLDEVEDIDNCISEDQHLSASALSERLMDAFQAHWDSAMGKGERS